MPVLALCGDPRYFSGGLSGGNRIMLMNGRGVGGPVNEMGGNILVGGANYVAGGIFAGKMK